MTAEAVEVTGAVTERLFGALLGAIELATVHLGVRLGLYDALATPRTAAGLAQAAGIDERYAREWLEQQAISGLVSVVEPGDGDSRVYGLDPEQAASFGDPDSPAYAGSMALVMGGVGQVLPQLPEVYRTGSGVPFGGYGDDVRLGQALFNRGGFLGQLTQEWVPALPGVAALLSRPGARALDLGCGVGWSSIALAAAYPGLEVLGIDSDDASVMDARANAEAHGVGRPGPLRGGRRRHPARRGGVRRRLLLRGPARHGAPGGVAGRGPVRPAARRGGRGGRRGGRRRSSRRAAARSSASSRRPASCTACPSGARSRTPRRPAPCSGRRRCARTPPGPATPRSRSPRSSTTCSGSSC